VVEGEPRESAELAAGDSLTVGNTLLVLSEEDVSEGETLPPSAPRASTVETLMSGIAADVRGLAAVFALNNALLEADCRRRPVSAEI
jgi:hypothetical protein